MTSERVAFEHMTPAQGEHQQPIQIIGAMTGELCCTIMAQNSWTIRRLKTQITNTEGTPVLDQKLLFNGIELEGDKIIGEIFDPHRDIAVTLLRTPPKKIPLHPSVDVENCDGTSIIHWTVDGRRMLKSNGQVASPPFLLDFGDRRNLSFRMVLHGNGRTTRKGMCGGKLQLKCDEHLPESFSKAHLIVNVKSGDRHQAPNGDVQHDFGQSASCFMLLREDWFDSDAKLQRLSTLVVRIQISFGGKIYSSCQSG